MKKKSCKYETSDSKGLNGVYFNCEGCPGKGSLSCTLCLGETLNLLYNNRFELIQYHKGFYVRTYHVKHLKPLFDFIHVIKEERERKPWKNIGSCGNKHREWGEFIENILSQEALDNPLGAYRRLTAVVSQYDKESVIGRYRRECVDEYRKIIEHLIDRFQQTDLIKTLSGGGKIGGILKPAFLSSHIDVDKPKTKHLKRYNVGDSEIGIYEDNASIYYHIKPAELTLSYGEVKTLNELWNTASEKHVFELIDPLQARDYFRRLGIRLLSALGGGLNENKLAEIFMRYTAGYGLLEILFNDPQVRDVYVDSPAGAQPVYIDHEIYGTCTTNIRLSVQDLERISSKFRSIGGRPFDEANPVLDMELQDVGVRVAGVREPSTFDGIAFAFRKRREKPWTLPKLVSVGMMSSKTAALLGYLVSGKCSILVTGARGSGKTSLLTALMSQINRNDRIVLMEDTPEVPVEGLRHMGWKIEHLRKQPPISRNTDGSYELTPEQNLRAALRLGESVLVLGEVRGLEAKALFEAMRVGAAGNAVLGTIHGSTPYDTWDRVTNDLKVPSTSFKAVDVVVSIGLRENRKTLLGERYLAAVTEVGKYWSVNPQTEDAFHDLMFVEEKNESHRLDGSLLLKKIAAKRNISLNESICELALREKMIESMVYESMNLNKPGMLEIENTVKADNKLIMLLKKQMHSADVMDYDKLFDEWRMWFDAWMGVHPDKIPEPSVH